MDFCFSAISVFTHRNIRAKATTVCATPRGEIAMALARFATILICLFTGSLSSLSYVPGNATQRFCQTAPYHEFDFWIGDWDSYDAHDNLQGHLLVTKVLDGCALQESWHGTDGALGSSFTIYDSTRNIWNQTWVSNHGTLLSLEGYGQGHALVLLGSHVGADKRVQLHRTTWTRLDGGRVHQLWDFSVDGGLTWEINYEGFLRHAARPFDRSYNDRQPAH